MRITKYILMISIFFSCNKNLYLSKNKDKIYGNEYLTTSDKSFLLTKKKNAIQFTNKASQYSVIDINPSKRFQSMEGFGFCLTDASAYLINKMSENKKQKLLKELFGSKDNNIGVSFIRISIGASDLSRNVYSYDNVMNDTLLEHFSLNNEETMTTIQILKQILKINSNLKILASPWSAPTWMKDNNNSKGGRLSKKYYPVYAKYLKKYIQSMKDSGITVNYITPQNEPLNPDNNPSMYMTAEEEKDFIKYHLGPTFRNNNIQTKIWVYDHNCDKPEYAMSILSDTGAAKFVDGSAFHLYAGDITALSKIHDSYPEKKLYFTEQYTSTSTPFWQDVSWGIQNLIIGASANWSKLVLEWNLASDPKAKLHTVGGCNSCLGAVTIQHDSVFRNQSYYIIAHASKFVKPNAYRIASTNIDNLSNIAFENVDGTKVMIVLNKISKSQNFNLRYQEKNATISIPANSIATYIWK